MLTNCIRSRETLVLTNSIRQSLPNNVRQFGNNSSRGSGRTGRVYAKQTIEVKKPTRSLKEILLQPTSGASFSLGSSAVAGASLVGLGSLCYYGLGMSKSAGIYDNSQ